MRSRSRTTSSSLSGVVPNAFASRERLPVTLPRERRRAARGPREPDGAPVAFHEAGDVAEVDRLVMAFEFAFVERLEKAAQAELLQIGRGGAACGARNLSLAFQCVFL